MKTHFIIKSIIIFLVISSCSPVLKTITGVRDIKVETVNELKEVCMKTGIDPGEAYIYRAEPKFEMPDSSQINFRFADQVLVFNKDGDRIIYKGKQTGNYCSLPSDDFFSGLNSIFLPLDTVNNLQNILKGFRNIMTGRSPDIDTTANFYLVYFWAKWYQSFTKKNVKSMREILKKADTTVNIQSFYLNNDFVGLNYPQNVDFKKLKIDVSL
jgi:hypothetical protein